MQRTALISLYNYTPSVISQTVDNTRNFEVGSKPDGHFISVLPVVNMADIGLIGLAVMGENLVSDGVE